MTRELRRVGVVGLGTMGAGIAEVMARSGLPVVGVEAGEPALAAGRAHLERSTDRAVARGRMAAQDRAALLGRVRLSTDLADLAGCDLVVEAVPERPRLKAELFARLDDVVAADAVLASNTSSLSVTAIAAATRHPGRVVGMHFFNPAPVLALVEVVRTVLSDPDLVAAVAALAARLGKSPVVVDDRAGFVANALLFGHLAQGVRLLESGAAGREDVDAAARLGAGLPMGPLALLDLIGLDTSLQVLETMHAETRDRLHAPPASLRRRVDAGLLGRKSGRGFHRYAAAGSAEVVVEPDGSSRGDPGAATAPPVHRAAVIGTSPAADALASVLTGAGVAVTPDTGGALDADLVLVGGDPPVDRLAELGRRCDAVRVIAVTGEATPVIRQAVATGRPELVVGLFPPDPALGTGTRLVECVRTVCAGAAAVAAAAQVLRRGGTHPAGCRDRPGRLVGSLLLPYLNDAVRMVESGYAAVADVDTAMRAGCGHPRGPFELLDALGAGAVLAGLERIHRGTGEPGHAPTPLLAELAVAGRSAPGGADAG